MSLELFRDFDVIVDGTDNFPRGYWSMTLLLTGKPMFTFDFRFEGQASVFAPRKGRAIAVCIRSRLHPG